MSEPDTPTTKVVKVKSVCKWFNSEKGFGFLQCEGFPNDVFVHKQQLTKSGIESIQEGDKVLCVINQGLKGHYATLIDKDK
jgi:CspA family cold shock protein